MADWNYVEWAERAGIENLKQRLENADHLREQANRLLQLLLVAMGGTLAYGARVFEPGQQATAVAAASLAVALWLCWVAVVLMVKCIATEASELLYNQPKNIYKPELLKEHTPDEIRAFELANIQARINRTMPRVAQRAHWLDVCRYATVATPLVFGLAVWVCR